MHECGPTETLVSDTQHALICCSLANLASGISALWMDFFVDHGWLLWCVLTKHWCNALHIAHACNVMNTWTMYHYIHIHIHTYIQCHTYIHTRVQPICHMFLLNPGLAQARPEWSYFLSPNHPSNYKKLEMKFSPVAIQLWGNYVKCEVLWFK